MERTGINIYTDKTYRKYLFINKNTKYIIFMPTDGTDRKYLFKNNIYTEETGLNT